MSVLDFHKSPTPNTPARPVACYHCNARFNIAPAARNGRCPKCAKRLVFDDLVVTRPIHAGDLATCGLIVIEKKASLTLREAVASEGVEVHGTLHAQRIEGGQVVIKKKAKFSGSCRGRSLVVEPGAVVSGGYFEIGTHRAGPSQQNS